MSKKVLVIGGGPGGSMAATLLKQGGLDVELLERAVFPRYHIGESVASSCRPMVDYMGAMEKVDASGFVTKRGVLLRWGAERDWTVDWNGLFGPQVSGWQVERDEFDKILLDHAAEEGVRVRQGATVKEIVFDGERAVGARWVDNEDKSEVRTTEFDYLVDASGRAGIMSAQHLKNRRPHEIFRNVAIWGYWKGAKLLPTTPEGGIDVISSPEGWYWVIPQKDDMYSVGFVTHKDRFADRRPDYDSLEDMLQAVVNESDTVRELIKDATYVAPVRVEQDYSYVADAFCGPGYYLVGDAACFLDPLLSSGVHLAMYSGMLSAAAILSTAAGEVTEAEGAAFFETLYRNAYARLLALVSNMYKQYQGKKTYFWVAQRLIRSEADADRYAKPDVAFGEIISGLTDLLDAGKVGGTAPMRDLIKAAEHARSQVTSDEPEERNVTLAPMRIDPIDMYDTASGLYLVTSPRLGIQRVKTGD